MTEKNKGLPRMRTIPKAYEEIKVIDPNTDLTIGLLRQWVKKGKIPTIKINNKILINLDLLIEKLNEECYNDVTTHIL